MIRFPLALLLTIGVAGCGPQPADGLGGVSASEADALNDAAAQLDAQAGAARSGEGRLNPAAMAASRADRGRH